MIIVRLVLHGRNMRRATGSWADANGPYKAIVTMFVESYALYTVSLLVSLGVGYAHNPLQFTFSPILAVTQVRAVLRCHDARYLGVLSDLGKK